MESKNATVALGDILKQKIESKEEVKPSNLKEWQLMALDYADKLGVDWKNLDGQFKGRWMALFKNNYETKGGKLMACYSFVVDYTRPLPPIGKVKMFFWRFKNLTH